jgi:predicted nucleic acid-binding Zn ribbon protein
MQCFVCGKALDKGYLCKEHSQKLKRMLDKKVGVVENPDFRHHCSICGEFKERVIIEYPSVGYFCNVDIEEENERYSP